MGGTSLSVSEHWWSCVSLFSCYSFAFPCHSLSLPVSEGSGLILTWEVLMVLPACLHCQVGVWSQLGFPNLVELTLQVPRTACPAELSLADFVDVGETGPCEERCVAGCCVTCSPWCCSVARGCQCHVIPVGKGGVSRVPDSRSLSNRMSSQGL